MKKQFTREFLMDMVWKSTYVEKNLCHTSRWSRHYEVIFESGGKFYCFDYSEGSTEVQDYDTFNEYPSESFECIEVESYDVVVKRWRAVKEEHAL